MTSNRLLLGLAVCVSVAMIGDAGCSGSSGNGAAVDGGPDVLAQEPCLDTTIEPATGMVLPGGTDAVHFVVQGPGTPPEPNIIMWTATGGTLPGAGAGDTSIVWTAPTTTGTYTIEILYQPIGGTLMCVDQLMLYVVPPSTGNDGGGGDDGDDSGMQSDDGDDSATSSDDGGSADTSVPPADAASDTSTPPPNDAGGACARDSGTAPTGPPMNVTATPSSAGVGAAILVSGTNLDSLTYGASLSFPPGVAAAGVEEDANGIWFTVPESASTGPQTLTFSTCAGTIAVPFTIDTTPAPSITSFTPSAATSGQTVIVTGQYFTGATQVWLTYFPAPAAYAVPIIIDNPLVVSDTALSFQLPTITTSAFRYVLVVSPSGAGASATELQVSP